MDKVKSIKLTALISKLTIAANKAVKKQETRLETRNHYSITGLNVGATQNGRDAAFFAANLLRN